ncbi:MAG TPA: caspase family protein [Hyphomicrobiaceae bacterium]|nr:caspase family protein [Hyphomicrobiaceae bacterium]
MRSFTKPLACVCLGVLALLLQCATADAARRAFIVGNGAYRAASPLTNPANDARDLAQGLSSLGYVVTLKVDVTRAEFLSGFQQFAASLAPDDLALFFFAGHGVQIGGENFLFPVDGKVASEAEARTNLIPLNAVLADLTRLSRNRIVILDACRNNPFAVPEGGVRSAAGQLQGLARVYAGVGSFIAYSTQPGNVALDGSGRNSPFTGALLRHLAARDTDVHGVMRRVRSEVGRSTGENQIPWENSSLVDEVTFAAGPAGGGPGATSGPRVQSQATVAAARTEQFHYVSGLDPKGDNFLALRAAPSQDAQRLATMGPDTLVKVVGESGSWRHIALRDGSMGWAHANWIKCCRTESGGTSAALSAPVAPSAPSAGSTSCEALWLERNAIWKRHGYCFTTERARVVFGNHDCFRDQTAARRAMSSADRSRVDALVLKEKDLGCR